jgi:uncharacterized protein YbaR (Trm112 family)
VVLDALFLEVLACPIDKEPLWYFSDEDILYNPRLKRSYVIVEGIPNLLPEESTEVGDAEHERLAKKMEAGGAQVTSSAKR